MRYDPWLAFAVIALIAFVIMIDMLVGAGGLPGFPEYGNDACSSVLERAWSSTNPACVLERDRQGALADLAAAVALIFGSGALTSFSQRRV